MTELFERLPTKAFVMKPFATLDIEVCNKTTNEHFKAEYRIDKSECSKYFSYAYVDGAQITLDDCSKPVDSSAICRAMLLTHIKDCGYRVTNCIIKYEENSNNGK